MYLDCLECEEKVCRKGKKDVTMESAMRMADDGIHGSESELGRGSKEASSV